MSSASGGVYPQLSKTNSHAISNPIAIQLSQPLHNLNDMVLFSTASSPTTDAKTEPSVTLMEVSPFFWTATRSSQIKVVVSPLTTTAFTLKDAFSVRRVSVPSPSFSVARVLVVKTACPDLEVRVPLDTLTSLETSLARRVTPKTAAKQATVRTEPTTAATFMLLTEPSTLDNCPLRLDMVDLLSASMMIVVVVVV